MIKGLFSHWIYNFISILVPMLMIPLLTRRLGVDNYGVLAYLQILNSACLTFADFGLCSIGPRLLANNGGDENRRSVSLISIHLLMVVVSTIICMCLLYFSGSFSYAKIFILSQATVFFSFFPPSYLLIHKGCQVGYGAINSIARLAHGVFVYLYVMTPDDIWIYFLSNFALCFFVSIALFSLLCRKGFSLFVKTDFCFFVEAINMGFSYFLKRISSLILSLGIPFLIQSFCGSRELSYYSLADKIRTLTWQVVNPVLYTFSPIIHRYSGIDKLKGENMAHKCLITVVSITFIISSFSNLFSEEILRLIAGKSFFDGVNSWSMASLGIVPSGIVSYYMVIKLSSYKKSSVLTIKFISLSLFCLLISIFFIKSAGAYGAVSVLIMYDLLVILLLKRNSSYNTP
ncbi:lipopolysaccharide biosynthesis protein [Methylomonas sp. HYX-M1]|uniref:lipopolysaccharide biosynthesis protein n=1 Tax=Methylomonas sp. HYX-M1 TaxID=3139307 RepID=UPI00345C0261